MTNGQADKATLWRIRHMKDPRIAFVECPLWFHARMIGQTVMAAERENIEVLRCGSGYDSEEIAERGHLVFRAVFGKESVFQGAVRLLGNSETVSA